MSPAAFVDETLEPLHSTLDEAVTAVGGVTSRHVGGVHAAVEVAADEQADGLHRAGLAGPEVIAVRRRRRRGPTR